jgi:hypothetical protein
MRKAVWVSLIFCVLAPLSGQAAVFDPDFVISNAEATETSVFDAESLEMFLLARGSGLARYAAADIDGVTRTAAQIIMGAADRYGVSPRFLLALLQREQSLMTDPAPSAKQLDWATGYGICDSCSMDDPALQKYRGFANQVDYAAGNVRYFMDNAGKLAGFRQAGVPTVIDGITVTPENAATANLYNYTPHLQAQENFWTVWQKYFVRRFPNGSLVTAAPDIPGTWQIRFGERRKIASNAVLLSRFDPSKVIKASANDLLAYPEGAAISFPDFSLLRSPGGTVFLLVGDERRGIASMAVFRKLGFNAAEVEDASWEDLNAYKEGAPVTLASSYPFGALFQDAKTGGVYFVQNGVKRPLYGKELLSLYFKSRKIKADKIDELAGFPLGAPVRLAEGELVRVAGSPTVYVISDGQSLPIRSAAAFERQGWKWENVVTVSPKVLALTPTGPAFDPNINIATAE